MPAAPASACCLADPTPDPPPSPSPQPSPLPVATASACCLPVSRLLSDWWPAVKFAVQTFDRKSSTIAFGAPSKYLMCACVPEGAYTAPAELV